ncbi:MAG: hypothetical protein QOI62_2803 [Solirubrobacteraceae bacterium]|jgi:hypothetical protein|nr:hypothetical protein [Solirubrobacteraceae bacterium]
MRLAARIAAVTAAAALALVVATPARADDLVRPARLDKPPPGYRMTGDQATAVADKVPKIVRERRKHRGSFSNVFEKSGARWQVSYYSRGKGSKEIAQVYVSDDTGRVTEAWTGPQVAWTMARGYPGAFGRKVNSPWVWIPLTLLFVAPFVDRRRPLRMRHLDLLVLSAFGVSVAFFNDAQIGISVPLAYPLLAYLLGRMLWIGLRRDRRPDPLRLMVPPSWLAIALIFLVGFRIGLNVADSNVIDVGYAGVIGADRLAGGDRLWGNFPSDNEHGDTYGPVNYAAYVPFEQLMPWSGKWDDLPAAHAAAVFFDLLCIALLFVIGRRLRGPPLGIALAYAWAAYPFTLYAMDCNVNDALVGALVLAAIAAASSPGARGALIGLAGMAKFAPLGLGPLLATHTPGARRYAVGLACVLVPCAAIVLGYGGLHTFYERTLAFQAARNSPFSIWGLYGWGTAQAIVQLAAVILAVAVAFLPRRRDTVGLAALSAAVLVALQLGVDHWFYLYVVWFFGAVMVALLGDEEPARAPTEAWSIDELGRLPAPAVAWR